MTDEPDYAAHLIRAEKAMAAIYPCMADRKYNQAALHAFEVFAELSSFLKWIATRKK